MLTKNQRAALAREARNLAMECVEGTAPALLYAWCDGYGREAKCGCAAGTVAIRSGLLGVVTEYPWELFWGGEAVIDAAQLVSDAITEVAPPGNDHFQHVQAARQTQAVFPLLALADALEAP